MILVISTISIVAVIVGAYFMNEYIEELGGALMIIGGLVGFAALTVTIVLAIDVSGLVAIDEKIEMYQSENSAIETQIAEVVEQYQKYETDIFTELSPESAITLVSLYPELKADSLVQKQIEVYVANNEKIKELKESKISGKVKKWWLYFGG
jgi:hypothetical protein